MEESEVIYHIKDYHYEYILELVKFDENIGLLYGKIKDNSKI